MKKPRLFWTMLSVVFFTLAGNWIGAQLYQKRTGRRAHVFIYDHLDDQNHRYITIPVWTNFMPGFLLGLMLRPHLLVSLLAGTVSTAMMGDKVQDRVMEGIAQSL